MTDGSGAEHGARTSRTVEALEDSIENGVACPRCRAPIPLEELFYEGDGACPGCAHSVRLRIETTGKVRSGSNWRNVPKGTEEMYR